MDPAAGSYIMGVLFKEKLAHRKSFVTPFMFSGILKIHCKTIPFRFVFIIFVLSTEGDVWIIIVTDFDTVKRDEKITNNLNFKLIMINHAHYCVINYNY